MTLREAREKAGLSLGDAARALSVSKTSAYYWETGNRPVSDGDLAKLAALYGVPAASLALPPVTRITPRKPEAPDELAERMVPKATELACLVREQDADGIGQFLAGIPEKEIPALLVVLAAMVPVDEPVGDLLAWVTWDGQAAREDRAA